MQAYYNEEIKKFDFTDVNKMKKILKSNQEFTSSESYQQILK